MDFAQVALFQTLISGVLLGCLFGTIAMGVSIKWGLLGIADVFHLALVLLGAYLSYSLIVSFGMHPLLTFLVTAPLFFAIGAGTQWVFERLKVALFTSLLVTFGMFVIVESAVTLVWSADTVTPRGHLPDWLGTAIRLPGPLDRFLVMPADLAALVFAIVLVGAAAWLLARTHHGRALRAMSQDPAAAEVFGVRLMRMAVVVSGLIGVTAALAGTVVALRLPLTPHMPLGWIGVVVVAALLGGLGRPLGALLASIGLITIQNVWSLWFQPAWAPVIAFAVLFAFLIAQPLVTELRARLAANGAPA